MASNTDKLKKLARKWVGQIGSGGVADAVVATIPLSSVTGLPTDTAVVATIDRVDANGADTGKEETVVGVVSGTNLVTSTRGVEGTAQAHDAGAVVEILVTAIGYNDIIDHLLVEHAQDGTHKAALVTTLKATGAQVTTGTSDTTIVTPKALLDAGITATSGASTAYARAYINAAQSIPTGAVTKVNLNAVDFDPGSDFASGTYTVPTSGPYMIIGSVQLVNPSDGKFIQAHIYKNGAGTSRNSTTTGIGAFPITTQVSTVLNLTATDTIDLRIEHNQGSALDTSAAADSTYLAIAKLPS